MARDMRLARRPIRRQSGGDWTHYSSGREKVCGFRIVRRFDLLCVTRKDDRRRGESGFLERFGVSTSERAR